MIHQETQHPTPCLLVGNLAGQHFTMKPRGGGEVETAAHCCGGASNPVPNKDQDRKGEETKGGQNDHANDGRIIPFYICLGLRSDPPAPQALPRREPNPRTLNDPCRDLVSFRLPGKDVLYSTVQHCTVLLTVPYRTVPYRT
jgi:hypothetical protein